MLYPSSESMGTAIVHMAHRALTAFSDLGTHVGHVNNGYAGHVTHVCEWQGHQMAQVPRI